MGFTLSNLNLGAAAAAIAAGQSPAAASLAALQPAPQAFGQTAPAQSPVVPSVAAAPFQSPSYVSRLRTAWNTSVSYKAVIIAGAIGAAYLVAILARKAFKRKG